MALIPNPNELFRRVDQTLESVDTVLGRVDGTLAEVSGTLADVRVLLSGLQEELKLLELVPALADQLADIHRVVTELTVRA